MRRKFRQGFPYAYEVLDCIDGFDPRDPNIETFYDRYHVARDLGDCLHDPSDMLLMIEMLQRHHRFDPTTCWQDAHVLHAFAALVFSGRVVLRKPEPKRRSPAKAQPPRTEVEPPAERPRERPVALGWIEIEIVDDEGNLLPNVQVEIELADGSLSRRKTNHFGKIRCERIPEGACELTLPRHDGASWDPN